MEKLNDKKYTIDKYLSENYQWDMHDARFQRGHIIYETKANEEELEMNLKNKILDGNLIKNNKSKFNYLNYLISSNNRYFTSGK